MQCLFIILVNPKITSPIMAPLFSGIKHQFFTAMCQNNIPTPLISKYTRTSQGMVLRLILVSSHLSFSLLTTVLHSHYLTYFSLSPKRCLLLLYSVFHQGTNSNFSHWGKEGEPTTILGVE